ncbi:MAG: LysR substrate-binding domain-containing protein [Sporolactobacillus sp.]
MQALTKLRVMEQLGKTHKISETANRLGLRQPTVTFHMQTLEKETGSKLFEQQHGYVRLTEAGQAFLHYAQDVNHLMDEAQRTMDELNEVKRGKLTIGASYVPATYVLPPVLANFLTTYPRIQVIMRIHPFRQLLDALARREVDFGLVYSAGEPLPDYCYQSIGSDELVIVYSKKSHLNTCGTLTADDLSHCALVQHGHDSSTRQFVETWMAAHHITAHVRLELNSIEAIKQMLMQIDAYSILSRLAVQQEINTGILSAQSLPGNPLLRQMNLIYLRNRFLTPASQTFIKLATAGGLHDDHLATYK